MPPENSVLIPCTSSWWISWLIERSNGDFLNLIWSTKETRWRSPACKENCFPAKPWFWKIESVAFQVESNRHKEKHGFIRHNLKKFPFRPIWLQGDDDEKDATTRQMPAMVSVKMTRRISPCAKRIFLTKSWKTGSLPNKSLALHSRQSVLSQKVSAHHKTVGQQADLPCAAYGPPACGQDRQGALPDRR